MFYELNAIASTLIIVTAYTVLIGDLAITSTYLAIKAGVSVRRLPMRARALLFRHHREHSLRRTLLLVLACNEALIFAHHLS